MHLQKSRLVLDLVDRAAKSSNIAWISPLEQDIYGPGSTILAKWASHQMIESPSFQLCMASSSSSEPGGCGATVWPEITESAGEYQAPVTVPDALWDGSFFLQMKDSSGTEMRSPVFTLSPAGASVPSSGSGPVTGSGSEPQAQAPLGPANPPVASVAAPLASPLYPSSAVSAPLSLSATPPPPSASESSQVSPAASASINPNVLSAKTTFPSAAAYAVPLSAVAAIILVASVLFLKHRRKRGSSHSQRPDKPSPPSRTSSCKSSSSGGSRSDVGHALRVLSRHYGHGYASASSRPPKPKKDRKLRLDSFPYPAYAQWGTGPPSPSYGYVAHHRDTPMAMATHRADSDSPRPPVPVPVEHPCRDNSDRPRPLVPVPVPMEHPCRDEQRPRLPPIATTGSFMSARSDRDPATHAVLADYLLPSPPLPSSVTTSTSTPRCLLPAPQQQVHLRDRDRDAAARRSRSYMYHMDTDNCNPLGSPPADRDRECSERVLYARVASKLSMYRTQHRS